MRPYTHRISPDGKAWFWWQIRASRIEYNNPNPVMLVTTTDVSPFKENETQLLESNERLRSAFEQTTQGMWEVDLQSRIFTLYHYSKSPQVTAPPQGKFPDFLIENGWIHPSSVKHFREFARELLEGRIQGYGNFIIQFQDTGCYSWASLSYQRLEDDAGAARAVGIIEKPPQTMQGPRETILTEHALPDAMTPYLVGVLHGNLSRNSVEKYWMEGRHAGRGTISCAQALEQGRKKMFSEDDRRSLSTYFDAAQLLALFARGERICSMDYRRVDGSGSIGWVNCRMNLAQDSLTRDIHLYLWLLRADARHRYEQELETPPVRDAETGLYDRATTRALVEARMNQGMAVPCAFALIQLEGLDRLEQTSPRQGSHPAAVLGPRALVGQYTRQELLMFFPEIANQDEVKQMLEGAFAFVRTSLADVKGMDSLGFVAEVVAGDPAQAHEAAVFLTRNMASTTAGEEGEPWRLAVLPLKNDQRMAGFLCIENPREHLEDAALAAMLVPHIAGEEKRFHPQGQEQEDSGEALLLSLPNLRSYTNAVCTLTSDAYSSMGAVCLDIPGLPSINGSLGFAYGREVLQYVSRALADLFGSTHLFRTWDAEFVTLCPNTTHEIFLGRCNRLRSVLECRYPKTVRVGYTWADGVFTGKELVNEARSIMRCERVPLQYRQDCAQGATLHSARDFIRPKRFTVYFQPKVNMTDGTVTGAEALVRGLDERGRLVSSGRFIPEMEEKGLIRDLDLYVLNRTLAQLDQWRRKGLASLPVSVNFSRFTLSDPALPASVLAIQSQYPLLEPCLVEVEITESAGNVESKSLSDAMDRFHQLGLQFALDDFGSQYANVALLTHVKFNCLKLDRTLISDLAGNRCSQMLVRDLVEICHTSGMRCVAEGVETQAQKEVLLQAGCIYGQGFLFDPPLSAEAFEKKYLHGTQKQ